MNICALTKIILQVYNSLLINDTGSEAVWFKVIFLIVGVFEQFHKIHNVAYIKKKKQEKKKSSTHFTIAITFSENRSTNIESIIYGMKYEYISTPTYKSHIFGTHSIRQLNSKIKKKKKLQH